MYILNNTCSTLISLTFQKDSVLFSAASLCLWSPPFLLSLSSPPPPLPPPLSSFPCLLSGVVTVKKEPKELIKDRPRKKRIILVRKRPLSTTVDSSSSPAPPTPKRQADTKPVISSSQSDQVSSTVSRHSAIDTHPPNNDLAERIASMKAEMLVIIRTSCLYGLFVCMYY